MVNFLKGKQPWNGEHSNGPLRPSGARVHLWFRDGSCTSCVDPDSYVWERTGDSRPSDIVAYEIVEMQTPIERALESQRQVGGDHYKKMGVQPWDVVDTWPLEQRIGYYRGGALKYIMRMGAKDETLTEIGKGQHYIGKLLEVLREAEGLPRG